MGLLNIESQTPENLYAGNFPRVTMPVTIASGEGIIAKNTVLGKITASGKYGDYDNGNADGSETAVCILTEDVDATSADVKTSAYFAGEFNEDALVGIDDNAKLDFIGTPIFTKAILD
jgi:hypothetical protein